MRGNTLNISPSAIVRDSTGSATFPVIVPFCSLPPLTCGGPDVRLLTGETAGPLAPGSYNSVRVSNSGVLTLAPGTFDFCSVQVGRNAAVRAEGAVTINVQGTVRVGNASEFVAVPPAPPIVLNVAGKFVRIGQFALMRAVITAPNALFSLGRRSVFEGSFCVDSLRNDKLIRIECPCSP